MIKRKYSKREEYLYVTSKTFCKNMYNGNKFLIYSSSKGPYLHYIHYQQKINKDQQMV